MIGKQRKILVVDDTATYRQIFTQVAENLPNMKVVGRAQNGKIALRKLREVETDIVFLDVFMPEMDGPTTLKHILKDFPKTQVIMFSSEANEEADIVIDALRAGALDFIPKPKLETLTEKLDFLTREVKRVLQLVDVRDKIANKRNLTRPPFPIYDTTDQNNTTKTINPPPPLTAPIDLIAIGVSTGGPNALGEIIPLLPEKLNCPILIVQHMPAHFTRTLADNLNRRSKLKVLEAKDKEYLKKDTIYIAPGGKHMVIDSHSTKLRLRTIETPPVNSCRPSVDVLFESIAKQFNGNILALILTGMGEDGANGIESLKQKQCRSIAQARQSCIVYGMPRAIINRGLADEIIPLQSIASRISFLCHA